MRPRDHRHTHACATCKADFRCYGTLSQNYDGFPEVWCSEYDAGVPLECEDCAAAVKCQWCGDPAPEAVMVDDRPYHAACAEELHGSRTMEIA